MKNFIEFMANKETFYHKVIYRKYICNGSSQMIINNLTNHTTTFLEDISAEVFDILYLEQYDKIKIFMEENDLTNTDVTEFIDDLIETCTLNNDKPIIDINNKTNTTSDESYDFYEKLFTNSYLFSFHLDLSNICNLNCKHCYHPFNEYSSDGELTLKEIKKLLDCLYDLGVFSLIISGGEPLLHKDFYEVLSYATKKGMIIDLFTNGTIIDNDISKKLLEFNINRVSLSLYSLENEIHDNITSHNGSCQKTKNAIKCLKDHNIFTEIKTVLMKDNFEGYKDLIAYARDNGSKLVLDTTMTPRLNSDLTPISLTLTQKQYMQLCLDPNTSYYGKEHKPIKSNERPCNAGRYSLYSDSKGNINPCVSLNLKLGNHVDVENIWFNSKILKDWQCVKNADFINFGNYTYCVYCTEICAGIAQLENNDLKKCFKSDCFKAQISEEAHRFLQK